MYMAIAAAMSNELTSPSLPRRPDTFGLLAIRRNTSQTTTYGAWLVGDLSLCFSLVPFIRIPWLLCVYCARITGGRGKNEAD